VSGWAAPESAEAAPGRSTPDGPEPSLADLGLRPESVARLSTSDRELLQRLQAELLQGRGPRLSGSNGRADPPNMAG
jgi:hypothetical protein